MDKIYEFFINTGKAWGLWDFFKGIGSWGTLFFIIACGIVLLILSILIIKAIMAIPNIPARTIVLLIWLAVVVFGIYIAVNLTIQTIDVLNACAAAV